jgi:hypothetical protein
MTLEQETTLLTAAGFSVEVAWRRPPFAVIVGWKGSRSD